MRRWTLFALTTAVAALTISPSFAETDVVQFPLAINPKVAACLSVSGWQKPEAHVTVVRGKQNDTMILQLKNIKPNLAFDLFTVEKSSLLPNGQPNPAFTNFGLAWYQSDIQVDGKGEAEVHLETILLDQIFGFDPVSALQPTNTFHVGFWFNNPKAAAACVTGPPTPFNGEHNAGPLAMISLPNAQTNLGPLCTQPQANGTCHP